MVLQGPDISLYPWSYQYQLVWHLHLGICHRPTHHIQLSTELANDSGQSAYYNRAAMWAQGISSRDWTWLRFQSLQRCISGMAWTRRDCSRDDIVWWCMSMMLWMQWEELTVLLLLIRKTTLLGSAVDSSNVARFSFRCRLFCIGGALIDGEYAILSWYMAVMATLAYWKWVMAWWWNDSFVEKASSWDRYTCTRVLFINIMSLLMT